MKTKEQLLLIACLMVTLCETGKDAEDLIQQGCVRKKLDMLIQILLDKNLGSLIKSNVISGLHNIIVASFMEFFLMLNFSVTVAT